MVDGRYGGWVAEARMDNNPSLSAFLFPFPSVAHGYTLITRNVREFKKVTGLVIDKW